MTARKPDHATHLSALLIGGALALGLASCAPAPKPPTTLSLTITGSARQNPDPSGAATPVAVVLYPLAATGKFSAADPYSLISGARGVLGSDLAGPTERRIIAPGATATVKAKMPVTAQALGIAVMFRDISKAKWRYLAPLKQNKINKLTLKIARLTATLAAGKGD